jgi:hypothetical protein
MNNSRIYAASFTGVTIGASAGSIIELLVPSGTFITLLKAWISPDQGASPADEVLAISIYGNDNAGSGGTAMTEHTLTAAAVADPSNCQATRGMTIGATPLILYSDAFHLRNGWHYLASPEEEIVMYGGNTDPGENIGLELAVASTATPTVAAGLMWSERSKL